MELLKIQINLFPLICYLRHQRVFVFVFVFIYWLSVQKQSSTHFHNTCPHMYSLTHTYTHTHTHRHLPGGYSTQWQLCCGDSAGGVGVVGWAPSAASWALVGGTSRSSQLQLHSQCQSNHQHQHYSKTINRNEGPSSYSRGSQLPPPSLCIFCLSLLQGNLTGQRYYRPTALL